MPEHGPAGNPHNSPFTAETGIPTDRFGYKTNKLGRGIDDFLASLIGGPQSPPLQEPQQVIVPTRGDGRPAVNNGMQAAPVPRPVGSISEYTDKLINFPRTETEGFGAAENTRGRVPVAPPETLMEPRPPEELYNVGAEQARYNRTTPPAQTQEVPVEKQQVAPVTTTAAEPPVQTTAAKPTKDSFWRGDAPEDAAPFEMAVDWVARGLGGYVKLGAAAASTVQSLLNDFFTRGGAGRDATEAQIEKTKKEVYGFIDSIKPGRSLYNTLLGETDAPATATAPVTAPNEVPPVSGASDNILDNFDAKVTDRNMAQLQNMPPLPTGRADQLAALRGQIDDPNTASRAPAPSLPGPQTQNKSELNVDPATLGEDQTLALGRHPYPLGAPVDSDTAHISLEDIVPTTDQIPDAVRNLPGFNAETGVVTLDPNDPNAIIALANALAGASQAQRAGVLNKLDDVTKQEVLAKLTNMDQIAQAGGDID
jgi:hypothetical protein